MYVNYGDKDFFEHGRLVDAEHEDNIYDILCCKIGRASCRERV